MPAFGRAFTLGVEEELFLVDRATLDAAPAFSLVVPDPGPRLKAELFSCLVETTTPVCRTAGEALDHLRRLREDVERRGRPHGVTLYAAGAHALARSEGQPIVPEPRYEQILAELGPSAYRQLVCGVHVHVGMPSAEACLRALEGVLPWLPVLLALSANSPLIDGERSDSRSARAGRLAELPHAGPPPILRTWPDWERATAGVDYTRLWWDARPHPRFGTLEVRIADQQTDVRRTAGLAALVQSLVAAVCDRSHAAHDRGVYVSDRAEAARTPPDPAEVAGLAALVEPAARELGAWDLACELLEGRPEAERQLAEARSGGVEAAARDVADRSLG